MALENVTDIAAGAAVEAAPGGFSNLLQVIPLLFVRLWDLVAAPFRHAEMLWIVFPLFFSLLVMELYFERHWDEDLGWAAAVANSLILIFVSIDLIKETFGSVTPLDFLKAVVLSLFGAGDLPVEPQVLFLILFVGAMGIAVTIINYFHLLPRKLAFAMSGHPPINFIAYFAIAIVYTTQAGDPIPFDLATMAAAALLFILLLIIVFIVKRSFPSFFSLKKYKTGPWR